MFNSIGGDAVGAFSGDNEANRALLLLVSCLTLVFYPHMLRHLAASETNLVRFTPAFACALHAILWQVATMQKLCRNSDVKHFEQTIMDDDLTKWRLFRVVVDPLFHGTLRLG